MRSYYFTLDNGMSMKQLMQKLVNEIDVTDNNGLQLFI